MLANPAKCLRIYHRNEHASRGRGVESGEWEMGNFSPLPTPHSPFPTPHSLPPQLLLQRANLVVKHSSQTIAFFDNGIDLLELGKFYLSGKNQVSFVFLQTALGDLQKTNVISCALSAISLRDIRRNR